ncbi:Ger(x)C family spore germination protein [Paenibacillus sp. NRS-1760]|uniref:Ger(x)C family spore germination protein n=1 Tax=Paenibacillus sp. NRS-1760 TaxID=3233902 RepID=UPI003D2BA09C
MMMIHSNNRGRFLLACLCTLTLLVQTGCWSKDEIEDLGLYVGIALDVASKTEIEKKMDKLSTSNRKKDLITYTLQIIDKQSEGKDGESSGVVTAKPYINVSETGDSLFEMVRGFSARMERPVIGHHLKVIVINEMLSRKYSMNNLLSFMLRDNNIRPNSLIVMSSGMARDVFESKGTNIIPSFRVIEMIGNRYRTLKIIPPMSLIAVEGKMHAKSSYLLQNIVAAEGEIEFSGAAVIKGKTQKFKGLLSEEELLGIMWLTGEGKGGLVKSYDPETKQVIAYEIKTLKSKIISQVKNGKISFHVNIESDGRLIEEWLIDNVPLDHKFVTKAVHSSEKEVSRLVNRALHKIQKEYKTDVMGFGTKLSISHPKVWQKVKEDWDEEFSRIPITYSIKLAITDTGAKRKH